MKNLKTRNIAMALAASGWLFASAASAEPVGFIALATGGVDVQRYGTNSWEAAVQDADIEVGDTIRTGFDSQAKVILVDDTTLTIDEDTEITIQSLHVGAAATRDRSIIRQTRGRMRTVVGSAFGGQTRMEIHTPTAVVGVKGTDLSSELDKKARLTGKAEDKGQWLLCLHDGHIVVRTPGGVGTPKPGNCVIAYANGLLSDELLNDLQPLEIAFSSLSFSPTDVIVPVENSPVGSGPTTSTTLTILDITPPAPPAVIVEPDIAIITNFEPPTGPPPDDDAGDVVIVFP